MSVQIGDTLKQLRQSKNLTQGQLAQILCVSDKAVSKWESGRGLPEMESIMTICRFYGISIDELFNPSFFSESAGGAGPDHTDAVFHDNLGTADITQADAAHGKNASCLSFFLIVLYALCGSFMFGDFVAYYRLISGFGLKDLRIESIFIAVLGAVHLAYAACEIIFSQKKISSILKIILSSLSSAFLIIFTVLSTAYRLFYMFFFIMMSVFSLYMLFSSIAERLTNKARYRISEKILRLAGITLLYAAAAVCVISLLIYIGSGKLNMEDTILGYSENNAVALFAGISACVVLLIAARETVLLYPQTMPAYYFLSGIGSGLAAYIIFACLNGYSVPLTHETYDMRYSSLNALYYLVPFYLLVTDSAFAFIKKGGKFTAINRGVCCLLMAIAHALILIKNIQYNALFNISLSFGPFIYRGAAISVMIIICIISLLTIKTAKPEDRT